jgi:cyclohexanecarboxyl-CoA dehydrogenase
MQFELDEGARSLAAEVRSLAAERVAPFRRESDLAGCYRSGLLSDLAGAGLFALRIPAEYGGRELDRVSVGVALEELAAADLSPCFPVLNAALVGDVLASSGDASQRSRWLPPIARGESIVALALTEHDHGTDAAAIEMRASEVTGGWTLDGEKTSVMASAYATHALVFARTGGEGAHGITAFYVDLDDPSVTRSPLDDLGCRSGGRGLLTFDGTFVPDQDVVGEPGGGFAGVMRGFAVSRAYIALMAIAVGDAALGHAMQHARERQAFGAPLGTFQSVAFPLVEHATLLHAARLLALESLWRADDGQDPRLTSNMVKWWAPKAAVEAVHQCLLTMGHFGWAEDGPIAQRLRDVIGLQIADGTAAATKLVVARQLLGRDCAP